MTRFSLPLSRRAALLGAAAFGALAPAEARAASSVAWTSEATPAAPSPVNASAPLLRVASRQLEVNGRAATVFGILDQAGRPGWRAAEGARFSGFVRNDSGEDLILHWHGQVYAPEDQDRARPGGGVLPTGATDRHDFRLTPGTHWMHTHTLAEQQLLAAPLVTRETDAKEPQEIIVMLHDFSFRPPAELMASLGGHDMHAGHGAHAGHAGHAMPNPMPMPMPMPQGGGDHAGHAGHMHHAAGAVHANDIDYDAFLANDRTLADPEVVRVERGNRLRLRIINGATATAFLIDTGALEASCVAVDGSPCQPHRGRRFPLAMGQRIDLVLSIPKDGGAFPILAQVEASRRRTGLVLVTPGSAVTKLAPEAEAEAPHSSLGLDLALKAARPLPTRSANRRFRIVMGEEPGYRWTLNGKVHGEHEPLTAKVGERIEIAFMNPTAMMHPMHLHGHHFQVVGGPGGRFSGPVRDTVIVPPHTPVIVAVDLDKPGDWYLHCHHLYHMATGMMTELKVTA